MGKYYKTGYVRPEILKHAPTLEELDTRPRDKSGNLRNVHSADAMYPQSKGTPEQYKELNINYYRNFNDFYTAMRGLSRDQTHRIKKPMVSGDLVSKWYEEYLRRDYLIATGQYRGVINSLYKENFMKAIDKSLKTNTLSVKDISKINELKANISKLTPEQFDRILRDKNKPSKATNYVLSIFEFYSMVGAHEDDDVTPSKYNSAVKKMFERNNINWDELPKAEKEYSEAPYYAIKRSYSARTKSSSARAMLRNASKLDLENISSTRAEYVAGKLLDEKQKRAEAKGKSYLRYRNDGTVYVPFVDTKTSESILTSYFNYLRNK